MKATGIVRRIDDLGRVVIPKEIRRTLRIREGDPLEIFTDREGQIILKKYSSIGKLNEFAEEYCQALYDNLNFSAIISDRDSIIAVGGVAKNEFLSKNISLELEKIIESKVTYITNKKEKPIKLFNEDEGFKDYSTQVIAPIVMEGDAIGSVILFSKEPNVLAGNLEIKTAEIAAGFLSKQT